MSFQFSLGFACAAVLLHVWIWHHTRRLRARTLAREALPENTPIFLVLLAAVEWTHWQTDWLPALAIPFLVARAVQAIGTDRRWPNAMRIGGALASWLLLLILAGVALWPLT